MNWIPFRQLTKHFSAMIPVFQLRITRRGLHWMRFCYRSYGTCRFPKMLALLGPWLALFGLIISFESSLAAQQIDFASQIRPILNQHCIACHGPDEAHRAADLRLDSHDAATEYAIVPGDPDESEVIRRITSDDDDDRMPPPEHSRLSSEEQTLLKTWIREGAHYAAHWAFEKPSKATIPQTRLDDWAYNEIDRFIALKLDSLQLTPSKQADSHRLIRRLSLDLTGLPPRADHLQRMANNPTRETYESIVDELLASSVYGEHWAAMWLDLARYADTIGYTEDSERIIWPWRDWVIQALNQNMPYDQFTIEQIAGDLLPDATHTQRLATAFHRNTLSNNEGGTIDEEFRTIAVKDRINTTVNVWMGLTMRCAECHTHKYDPISIEEYYQFYDFFNQTEDADRQDEEPRMNYFPSDQLALQEELKRQIDVLNEKISQTRRPWMELVPTQATSRQNATLEISDDHSISLLGEVPDTDDWSIELDLPPGQYFGLRLEVLPDAKARGWVGRASSGNFILSHLAAALSSGAEDDGWKNIPLSEATADFNQAGYDIESTIGEPAAEKGWAVAGAPGGFRESRMAIFSFAQPIENEHPSTVRVQLGFRSQKWVKHLFSRFRITVIEVDQPVQKYRDHQFDPPARERVELERRLREVSTPVKVPIMKERAADQKRATHVMNRGSYLSPAEQVSAAVLSAFHPVPDDAPMNRLGIAQWLIDSQNPLTARVAVNRFWSRLFGRGIVETEEDFGLQGTMPTHPELLDWLAVDFQENGWNVKRLLKQMVMSATYRQSNQASPALLEADPRNLYFARGPRIRLSAEIQRDQALSVSGLLSQKMYGPPVYPPNPIKVVRNAFAGDFVWQTNTDEDRYRRAIYTFHKRSQPHPLFETFDVATRQVCSFRRINTNTPLQSLMTLNDEAFVECAQQLARQMKMQSGDLSQQLRWGLVKGLCQPASEPRVQILAELVTQTINVYRNDIPSARQMAGVADSDNSISDDEIATLASLTVAANAILNLDVFLTN